MLRIFKLFSSRFLRIRRRAPDVPDYSNDLLPYTLDAACLTSNDVLNLARIIISDSDVIKETEQSLEKDKRAVIRKEAIIREHQQRIAVCNSIFRANANSRLPIMKLPVELLAEIFFQCMVVLQGKQRPKNADSGKWQAEKNRYERNWLASSQVCQRWRDIALAYPLLWLQLSTDYCCSPLILEILFSRSHSDFPLNITLNSAKKTIHKQSTWIPSILKVSHRIQTLNLDPSTISSRLLQHGESSFTQLKNLNLAPDGPNLSHAWGLVLASLKVAPPSLRTLTLTNANVTWRTLPDLPTSITSLQIEVSNSGDCADAFRVLENLPRLERLTINGLPRAVNEPPRTVRLAGLKECILRADFVPANYFVQCLSLPSITQFMGYITEGKNHSKDEICSFILLVLGGTTGGRGPFTSADVWYTNWKYGPCAEVVCNRSPCANVDRPDLLLSLTGQDGDSEVIDGMSEAIAIQNPPIKVLFCDRVLGPINRAKGVEILELNYEQDVRRIFSPLGDEIPLPTLQELILNYNPTKDALEYVYECLHERHARGHKLRRLRFKGPRRVMGKEGRQVLHSAIENLLKIADVLDLD